MAITLEQIRALEALSQTGSLAHAAKSLNRQHTGILYLLKTLEDSLELKLLDRSQYRTTLTPVGARVLEEGKHLLHAEENLEQLVSEIKLGWEPKLKIVYDGACPIEPLLDSIAEVRSEKSSTQIELFAAFHSDVEMVFKSREAQMMLSILTPEIEGLESIASSPLKFLLVTHRGHLLGAKKKIQSKEVLEDFPLVTILGADVRLGLSTQGLRTTTHFQVGDFHSKKLALIRGIGYGWMPEYMVKKEVASGLLVPVKWEGKSIHVFNPRLYFLSQKRLGKSAQSFLKAYRNAI